MAKSEDTSKKPPKKKTATKKKRGRKKDTPEQIAAKKEATKKRVQARKGVAKKGNRSRKGVKRSTQADVEIRVERAIELLLKGGIFREKMKTMLVDEFGCSRVTAANYVTRARKVLSQRRELTRSERHDVADARLSSIAGNENESAHARIKAQRELNLLDGLYAPGKIAITDTHGQDLSSDEKVGKIIEIFAGLAESNEAEEDSGVA